MFDKALFSAVAISLGAAAPAASAAQPDAAAQYSARLAKLDPLRRSAVVRRAILDDGNRCKRAAYSARQGRFKNLEMWVARCEPTGDYALFIGPDASVQVRPCADLAGLKLPVCRLPAAAKK